MRIQRQGFEDVLKVSANQLSSKTDATTLVRLVRMCAFITSEDKDENRLIPSKAAAVTDKLTELLKSKLNSTSDRELAQVYSSLVILPT